MGCIRTLEGSWGTVALPNNGHWCAGAVSSNELVPPLLRLVSTLLQPLLIFCLLYTPLLPSHHPSCSSPYAYSLPFLSSLSPLLSLFLLSACSCSCCPRYCLRALILTSALYPPPLPSSPFLMQCRHRRRVVRGARVARTPCGTRPRDCSRRTAAVPPPSRLLPLSSRRQPSTTPSSTTTAAGRGPRRLLSCS